jgi:hypothetical protein
MYLPKKLSHCKMRSNTSFFTKIDNYDLRSHPFLILMSLMIRFCALMLELKRSSIFNPVVILVKKAIDS